MGGIWSAAPSESKPEPEPEPEKKVAKKKDEAEKKKKGAVGIAQPWPGSFRDKPSPGQTVVPARRPGSTYGVGAVREEVTAQAGYTAAEVMDQNYKMEGADGFGGGQRRSKKSKRSTRSKRSKRSKKSKRSKRSKRSKKSKRKSKNRRRR